LWIGVPSQIFEDFLDHTTLSPLTLENQIVTGAPFPLDSEIGHRIPFSLQVLTTWPECQPAPGRFRSAPPIQGNSCRWRCV